MTRKSMPTSRGRLRPAAAPTGKAASVLLMILLGVICGVGWAVYDYRQAGGDLNKLMGQLSKPYEKGATSKGAQESPPRAVAKAPGGQTAQPKATPPKTPAPPKGTPVRQPVPPSTPPPSAPEATPAAPSGEQAPVVARQPDVRVPAPPATPAVAPPANAYPFDEVFKALRESEADLKSGRFAEARERLNKYEPSRMIDKQQKEFVSLRDRCELQFNLLRETNITPSREPPKLSTIEFKVPKGPFTGTITAKDAKKVEMLLLSNISVTFDMFEVLQITEVDALRAKRMVEAEVARREKQVRPGRPMDAFRVAEFCLRNGQMDRVSEFFDRASQMASQSGADLIGTVRDEKAAGLYDTFVFFMSIGNLQEARSTLDLLRLRYPQSPLNEQAKALEEETTRVAMETLRRDIKPRAQPRPKPVEPPPAAPSAGGAGQPAVVAVAPPPAPKGTEPPAPEIAAAAKEESNVVGNVSAVPADKQDAFRAAVDEAHSNYDKAVEHLKRSDPATNPDGWGRENKIALDLLTKAFDLYNKALDIFNDQTLWDRVRDTNFKRVLCRKRELMK